MFAKSLFTRRFAIQFKNLRLFHRTKFSHQSYSDSDFKFIETGMSTSKSRKINLFLTGLIGIALIANKYKPNLDLSDNDVLEAVVPNQVFSYTHHFQMPYFFGPINMSSNMAIIKLEGDRGLLLYNPVEVTEKLRTHLNELLEQMSEKKLYIVVANNEHMNFFRFKLNMRKLIH